MYTEIGDVTVDGDAINATTINSTNTTGTAAADDDEDEEDDVEELSSSDVSGYTDVKHNGVLTTSTDDNIAYCRSAEHMHRTFTQNVLRHSYIPQTLWHYPRTITTPLCFRCVLDMLCSHVFNFLLHILYCFIISHCFIA